MRICEARDVEQELLTAHDGHVPAFQGRYNLHSSSTIHDGQLDNSAKFITLTLSLEGQRIIITRQRTYRTASQKIDSDDKDPVTYNGRLGSIDLIEEAIKAAIAQRWPQLAQYIDNVKTTDYAVHAIGNLETHNVSVHLQVSITNGKVIKGRISKVGSDSIDISFQALMTIYNWVAWKLLRRINGEEKAKDRKPRGKQQKH